MSNGKKPKYNSLDEYLVDVGKQKGSLDPTGTFDPEDLTEDQRTALGINKTVAPGPGSKKGPSKDEAAARSKARSEDKVRREKDSRPEVPDSTRLQLNHLVFQIPPEQINIQHEIKNVSVGVLRSPSTQKVRTGHGFLQVTIPLVFTSRAAVNAELVELLYMLRRTPYCWTENEYLRKTLMPGNKVDAMMLTLQSITVQSVANLPTTFQAILQFLWFNYKPYVKEIKFRKWYHMNLKMEPSAFGPEAFQPGNEYSEQTGLVDIAANFADPTFRPRNRFQDHLDDIATDPDKDKRVVLYDYLQEPVKNPAHSEAWSEFIRGASQNRLSHLEFGGNIAPDKYFRMAWKEFNNFPKGPPKDQTGWELEDPAYAIYSRKHTFSAHSEFIPIHASVQFSHRIASLPLLNQQMPTHQYLGPTDRQITLVFNITPGGKFMLELFREHIERFEQQVIDFRAITKDAYMEIETPLAKVAGLVRGKFGYKVIPESIDIETTPGNPGNSQMRVTFAEFNPSVYEDQTINPYEKEDDVLSQLMAGIFNRLSGGKPEDILTVNRFEIDQIGAMIGRLDQAVPGVEVWLDMTKNKAQSKGMLVLWEAAVAICAMTQKPNFKRDLTNMNDQNSAAFSGRGNPFDKSGDPLAFSFSTDEQTYGFKGIAGVDAYWGGDYNSVDDLDLKADSFKYNMRKLLRQHLNGDLADIFPTLSLELAKINVDLSACYPDMSLPPHPATGRITDTEPDFYLTQSKILGEADNDAKIWAINDIMPAIAKLVREDSQTAMNNKDNKLLVTEPEESVSYSQGGPVNMDNLPAIDSKYEIGGTLTSQEAERFGGNGFSGDIGPLQIMEAGLKSIERNNELGFRKAFPTFRLYFIKEGRETVDYSNFYEARGGFAVKEIRVVRSRKIPTDTLVIDLANLDGFLETDKITDIRKDDLQSKQSRYTADNRELFYAHDDKIKSQLTIHNGLFRTQLSHYFVKQIMTGVSDDPSAGEYGPLGTTIRHAELVDGQPHTPDQLSDPVTSIRIGTFLLCRIAFQNKDYADEARFLEIVATTYKFPEQANAISQAVAEEFNQEGLITENWYKRVRDSKVESFAKGIRPQASAESAVRRSIQDREIEKQEEKIENMEGHIKAIEKVGRGTEAQKKGLEQEEGLLAKEKTALAEQKKEREKNSVREPVSRGIIFKEGTDIVLRLGYSNNPEKLETVFVGHVTEAQAGPGTLQIVAQSFATELIQEIKGVKDGEATMKGASKPTVIANWILSMPEVKHFGRWEDAQEITEDQRNIRGVWYKKWNWTNNPSDDNIYMAGRDVSWFTKNNYDFTLNGRTLWQGLFDLSLFLPGYVFGTRPYLDLDAKGHRRWRNTAFIGTPDMSYLWRVPDDWDKVKYQLGIADNKVKAALLSQQPADVMFYVPADPADALHNEDPLVRQKIADRNLILKESQDARREPFRRYHMLSSYTDIIDNSIILTKRDVPNGIKLRGRKGGWRVFGRDGAWVERQLDGMDESHIHWQYVENDNAMDDRAQRMATSMLMTSLRDIYSGDITILGNPTIQPFDVCFLNDFYNDMSGPFEVEQVVHTFSESTGFITQIKPDLFTSIAETAQRTAMGALSAYAYRYATSFVGWVWDRELIKPIPDAVSGDLIRQVNAADSGRGLLGTMGGLTALAAMTYKFPLFMAPVLLSSYFIGGYLRDHAIIRVVPLFHKGIPFVTGLEGFRAPETGDTILEQFRLLRRSVSEGVDAVADLWSDVNNPNRYKQVRRSIVGW